MVPGRVARRPSAAMTCTMRQGGAGLRCMTAIQDGRPLRAVRRRRGVHIAAARSVCRGSALETIAPCPSGPRDCCRKRRSRTARSGYDCIMPASPQRQLPANSGTRQHPVAWRAGIDSPSQPPQAGWSRWQGCMRHGLESVRGLNFGAMRHVSGAGANAACRPGVQRARMECRAHPSEAPAASFGSDNLRKPSDLAS